MQHGARRRQYAWILGKKFIEQEGVLAKFTNNRWRVVVNKLANVISHKAIAPSTLSKQSLEKDTMTPESAA